MILGIVPIAYRAALNHGLVCWLLNGHDPSERHSQALGRHRPTCTRCKRRV